MKAESQNVKVKGQKGLTFDFILLTFFRVHKAFCKSILKHKNDCNFAAVIMGVAKNSAERNLPLAIDCQNRLALRAAEAAFFCGAKPFRTNRARKHFRENRADQRSAAFEKGSGILQSVFDVEKLRKAQKLENFIYFWLDFQKHYVTAPRLHHFQKRCKRANSRRGNIIKRRAIED